MSKGAYRPPKNLYQREGVFYCNIYHKGQRHRECLHTTSEREALKRLSEIRDRLAVAHTEAERFSFKEAVVEWSDTFLPGKKWKTTKRYLLSLKALDGTFGDVYLDQITPKLLGRFIATRRKDEVTNQTIKNDLTALSTILRVAMANGWIDANPAATYDRRILAHKAAQQKPPSAAVVARVLAYKRRKGKDRLRALVAFLHASGCRLGEATRLRWRDVDLTAGTVTLVETKTRPRTIRLRTRGGDAAAVLTRLDRHPHSDFVFWHDDGQPFRQASPRLRDLYKRVAKAEEAEKREFPLFRTHDLRHAFAIGWLNAGGDIYELSRHLGHSSVKTTEQNYLRWMDPNAKDRYEARADAGMVPAAVSEANSHKTATSVTVYPAALAEWTSEGVEIAG